MRRRLPPLAALRAFEAAGRLLSFSKAGEELLVGQSAISHHIRVLEQYLGVSLFVRQVRAVRLTQEGSRYLAKVTDAFDLLADATTDVSPPAHGVVRVRLLASFAVHWLMPRLGRFRALHPNTEVVLDASIDLTDLDSGEVDLAIRYGGGNWPGLEIRNLMSEAISPVMSPALITQGPILNDPSDLMGHDILVSSSHRGGDWDAWSHAAGIDPNCLRQNRLHDYNIVLQAALDGQGVAMGRYRLVADKLAAGLLVQPFSLAIETGIGWWIALPKRKTTNVAETFINWLIEEAAMDRSCSCIQNRL
jgi:LysR family glycine cleavage system transcriptional activator